MLRADLAVRAPLPRDVPVHPRPARVSARLFAWIVDWLITIIVGSLLVSAGGLQLLLASDLGRSDAPESAVYLFFGLSALTLPAWLIATLIGWSVAGRSVGKLAVGLRIVNRRGETPGFGRALIRLLVFSLVNLPLVLAPAVLAAALMLDDPLPRTLMVAAGVGVVLALLALSPALFTQDARALHDLLAGTMVVEE